MAGKVGGARPNSGRPLGSTGLITSRMLRSKFEELSDGESLEEHVIRAILDFKHAADVAEDSMDRNAANSNYIKMMNMVVKHCFQPAPQQVEVTTPEELPREQLEARIAQLQSQAQ